MRRILTVVVCFVLAMAVSSAARADLVEDFWTSVLSTPGIEVGDTIRVVFITSATIDGNGTTQAYYDGFGDAAAANGILTQTFKKGPITSLQPLTAADWYPLVSTAEVAGSSTPVATWINSSSSNVKVFNTAGQLVANSGSAMLDTDPNPLVSTVSLVNGIRYDESADDQAPGGRLGVWTGTAANGNPAPSPGSGVQVYLGSPKDPNQAYAYSVIGDGGHNANLQDWLEAAIGARSVPTLGPVDPDLSVIQRSIYVMSGEITVVPEPSTVCLWLGMTGVAGLMYWRKRRRS